MQRRHLLKLIGLSVVTSTELWAEEPGLAVIVHPNSGYHQIDTATLEAIFTTRLRHDPEGERLIPFNLPPHHPLRVAFDEAVLGMGPDEVARYWVNRKIRGGSPPPRHAPTPQIAVRVVARLAGAITYAPASLVQGNVRVIARVVSGKVLPP